MTPGICPHHGRRAFVQLLGIIGLIGVNLPLAGFAQTALPSAPMKIGIVGSGRMGGTLAMLWVKAGHPVVVSSTNQDELNRLVESLGPLAKAGTVQEALKFGDAAVIAVPYGAYPQIGKDYAQELAGKVVLDLGNAVLARDGEIANEARENGIGITSARYLAGARIVRAFNTLSYRILADNANRSEGRIAIPLAGDDRGAVAIVSTLVQDAGFDPVVIGPLVRAKDFAQGAPLYGQQISADEMRARAKALQ